MTNMKKLLMFAVAGLVSPAALHTADAEVRAAKVTRISQSPRTDKAPVSGTPARLRRTDEEQPGFEQATVATFADGSGGIFFAMATELNGIPANRRIQLAAIPFSIVQDATDGSVGAVADMANAKFVTNNNGNEYRNANHPTAYAINNGNAIAVEYNYQANGTNDTKRYMKVFSKTGAELMGQTLVFAKNNDDCGMHQDGEGPDVVSSTNGVNLIAAWEGCNGNGRDDGWVRIARVTCDGPEASPTSCSHTAVADLSVCPREERSHGTVSHSASDPNTVIASWTEGNTQPQRDGTWLAAINVGPGENGANAQSRLLWKKQVEGRKDIDGLRTYSMRAMQTRIKTVDATTGQLVNSDQIIWRSGDLRGNNNTNGKGGTYYRSQMAVIEATAAGMKYITPLSDMSTELLGLDGTHLGMEFGLFGTTTNLVPGLIFLGGSHTGGGYSAQARAVTWDAALNKFTDAGMYAVAPYDRHLYPNYLGNNPGNQGRNFSDGVMIANPYVGQNGNTDAFLMIYATTGKDPSEMTMPEYKLSAYLSVLPIAQTPKVTPPGGTGGGTGEGGGGGGGGGGEETPVDDGSGTAIGGCSTSNSTGGAFAFLLIGLALIRRRR
jgi:uncharacterized protein (TIGR03382 family)